MSTHQRKNHKRVVETKKGGASSTKVITVKRATVKRK
jgi:hypothetical protein